LHNKKYATKEDHDRKKLNWKINDKFVKKHNAEFDRKLHTYKTKHNKYSDLNFKEYQSMKGFKPELSLKKHSESSRFNLRLHDEPAPAQVDWRPLGYCSAIQDQGQCGCCYSFSACGAIEGQLFKKGGTFIKLSEQQMLDCSQDYGNAGCDGGTMNSCFTYVQMNGGIVTADAYPYEGQVGENRYDPSKSACTLTGYVDVPYGDIDALTLACAQVGPIAGIFYILKQNRKFFLKMILFNFFKNHFFQYFCKSW